MRRGQLGELSLACPGGVTLQGHEQQRPEQREPQPARLGKLRMGEVHHGTLRIRVLASTSSSPNSPSAASNGHWNSGV